MDLLIYLAGVASGVPLTLWALRVAERRKSAPRDLTGVPASPDGWAFPSLSQRDLEEAIRRSHRGERFADSRGYFGAARSYRSDRARYEAELERRREHGKAV